MPRKALIESVADEQASPKGVAAVDRALTLLTAYQHGDSSLSLSELAERTRLYPSTVSRLLASLIHIGLIERTDGGRYQLGMEIVRLHGVFRTSFSIDSVVMPVLLELVEATEESAAYHVAHGEQRLCLHRVDSPHPIRDHTKVGDVLPLHSGSGGRVLTAFADQLPKGTSAEDKELYEKIRKAGFFGAVGDRLQSVAGISAPVFKSDTSLAGAITLTMPSDRYDERYARLVKTAAQKLSKLLP